MHSDQISRRITIREKKRASAEFRIENELEPRLKQECAAYDRWVSTDRAYEWCEAFDYQVGVLVDMFEEDFDWSQFDFDGDDITDKIAKLIGKYLNKI